MRNILADIKNLGPRTKEFLNNFQRFTDSSYAGNWNSLLEARGNGQKNELQGGFTSC
jgi:hypothetical protein